MEYEDGGRMDEEATRMKIEGWIELDSESENLMDRKLEKYCVAK